MVGGGGGGGGGGTLSSKQLGYCLTSLRRRLCRLKQSSLYGLPNNDNLCHPELDSGAINQIDRARVEHGMTNVHAEPVGWAFLPNRIASPVTLHPSLNHKCAFTLAEVLITLGIIGIVAALTIPNIITNYQKKQTAAQLKKAYSQLAQALEFAKNDNGPVKQWSMYVSPPVDLQFGRDLLKYIVPYFKGASIKYAYNSAAALYGKARYPVNFKGENTGGAPLDQYWMETADGMFISAATASWSEARMFFQIDINGAKKPNVFGKDIFYFSLDANGKLSAYGSAISRDNILKTGCCKTCSGRGESCSSVIVQDGWVIAPDYPW